MLAKLISGNQLAPPDEGALAFEWTEYFDLEEDAGYLELLGHSFFVYITASSSRALCVGLTNDLESRVYEHKQGMTGGFTTKYRVSAEWQS